MQLQRDKAPGCYGSPTAYCSEVTECQGCVFADMCSAEADARFEAIQAKFAGVLTPLSAAVKKPRTHSANTGYERPRRVLVNTDGLPKKAAELVTKIAGVPMVDKLRAGKNPFAAMTPAYMRETFDVLLAHRRFEKAHLREHMEHAFGWSRGTASGHVSFIIPALVHLGVIEQDGKIYKIKEA